MGDFFEAVLGFPVVVLSFLLLVVIGYWVLVLFGLSDMDDIGPVAPLGGDVPASIALSLAVLFSWFFALVVTVLVGPSPSGADLVLGGVGLVLAVVLGLVATRLVAVPLRGVFRGAGGDSREAFVGRVCVLRTGWVDGGFGQAEVVAADGSTAVVQVRHAGDAPMRGAGGAALIHGYDPEGEFFWVSPMTDPLDPIKD